MKKMVKGTKKVTKTANKAVKTAKTAKKPVKKTTAVKNTKKNVKAVKTANKTVKKPTVKTVNKEYEMRKDFIRAYGFESVSDFATALSDDIANTTKVLQGKQKPNIEKMIKYAIILKAGLGDVINLFYPKEMAEYKKNHNKKRG